jgi:hypothetical protein
MNKINYYNGEEWISADIASLQDNTEDSINARTSDTFANVFGVVGSSSLICTAGGGYVINVSPGVAYSPTGERIYLSGTEDITLANPDSSDDRWDFVIIQPARLTGTPLTRRFKDINGNIYTDTVNKSDDESFTIDKVTGSPDDPPVKPAQPSGWYLLAAVYRDAGEVNISPSNIYTDFPTNSDRLVLRLNSDPVDLANDSQVTGVLGVAHLPVSVIGGNRIFNGNGTLDNGDDVPLFQGTIPAGKLLRINDLGIQKLSRAAGEANLIIEVYNLTDSTSVKSTILSYESFTTGNTIAAGKEVIIRLKNTSGVTQSVVGYANIGIESI